MKWKWILFAAILCLTGGVCQVQSSEKDLLSQVWAYNGKSYQGVQSPEYISYDLALRNYLTNQIRQRFGVSLDPKKYSGFDLLEIGSLFKCKKSSEPFDLFLKGFPKHP
ncbi:MAG: hypothetical protein A2157_05075 [Deltaproteobacteria bacterium RBG_16_47_11]|nr:MAG: hypothetical protein A2157_05075 [Deltaproteobacteria bacterium RBG_16_47_11]